MASFTPPAGNYGVSLTVSDQNGGSTSLPLTAGLVSWWPGEGNANDLADGNNLGYGNNGTWHGNATYAAGQLGQAFSFDGNSSVQVPDASNLDLTNAVTLEAWINPSTLPGSFGEVIAKGSYPNRNYGLFVESDGNMDLSYYNENGLQLLNTDTVSPITELPDVVPVGQWSQVAGVIDTGQGVMQIYVNGQLVASGSADGPLVPNTAAPLTIGSDGTYFFNGLIDEPSVYNQALSPSEIQATYNAGLAGELLSSVVNVTAINAINLDQVLQQTQAANPGQPITINLGTFSDDADAQSLAGAINAVGNQSQPVTFELGLAAGDYQELNLKPNTGVTVVVSGTSGQTTITGASPALTVSAGSDGSGSVIATDLLLTTATAAPTVLVTGGSLTLRNDIIEESTGYAQAAVSLAGGTLDLGTAADPGNNILDINGLGEFVHNTTANSIPATGDTFEVNGVPISAPYLSFTSLASSSPTTVYGQAVTLTASVRANTTPGSGTPTGSVDFFDVSTNTDLGSVSLSGGSASLTTTALGAGNHLIRALYSGDSNFTLSLDALTQTVTPAPLTITANNQTKVYGQANPALTVSYSGFVNGDTSASLTTQPTVTTTATTSSPVGSYPITASGAVDPNYTISYVAGTLTISPDATTTAASSSTTSTGFGQTVTLTATVTANAPGSGTPTGTVDFFDTTTGDDLGSVALSGGKASLSTASLPVGAQHDQGLLFRGRQLPHQQHQHGHDHDRPVDHRPRPVGRRGAQPLGQREHQLAGGVYVDSSSSTCPLGQRQRRDQSVRDRRARRRPEERQRQLQPGADHRRAPCRRPARLAGGAEHVRPDQLRLREPERELVRDDQAGHLQPDQRLGQRQRSP